MNRGGLDRLLRRVGRAVLLSELARAVCGAVAVLVLLALLAVAVDASLSLPGWALVLTDAVLCAAAAVMAMHVLRALWRNRYRPKRVARLIETRIDMRQSRLINAVDLSMGSSGECSAALRELAVSRGVESAAAVEPSEVVDRHALRTRAGQAGAAVLLAIAGLLMAPGVFRAVLPRLLNPYGNLPPYTMLNFDVRVEPETVFRGRPAKIIVELSGTSVMPKRADIVFLDDNDDTSSMPMSRGEQGAFTLSIDRPDRSRWFYVDTPSGRSSKQRLVVHEVPTFRRVLARFEFPEYTRWDDATVVLGTGGKTIQALSGTRVHLSVDSNQSLKEGVLTLTPADAPPTEVHLSPTTDDTSRADGSFVLTDSGTYSISLTGASGAAGEKPFEGKLAAVSDQPPAVDIVEPGPMVISPRTSNVRVAVRAVDDVAVERMHMMRSVNAWGPYRKDLPVEGRSTRTTSEYGFDLSGLGAEPGDVITYFAVAYDGFGPGQSSDTPIHVIRVISHDEYVSRQRAIVRMRELADEMAEFHLAMSELHQLREDLAEEYKRLLDDVAENDGQWSEEHKQRLAELNARRDEYALKMRDLAKKMRDRAEQPAVWDSVEKQLADTLRSEAAKLEAGASAHDSLSARLAEAMQPELTSASASELAREMLDQLQAGASDTGTARLDQARRDLERLAKADRMLALMEQMKMVIQQQRELADRLGEFRNREQLSPAEQMRAQRMGREQAQLKDELSHLLKEMRETADESASDLPKMSAGMTQLADTIEMLDVQGDQSDAATLAAAGQGRYAHRAADLAAEKLESLYSHCMGSGGAELAMSDLDRALALRKQAMSDLIGDLNASRQPVGFGGADGAGAGGYYGSRAPWQLAGEDRGGSGYDEGPPGPAVTGTGGGRTSPSRTSLDELGRGSETLLPEQGPQRSYAPVMLGVPPQYRDLAEAYFRRLADESR